jgi:hypothetical protein
MSRVIYHLFIFRAKKSPSGKEVQNLKGKEKMIHIIANFPGKEVRKPEKYYKLSVIYKNTHIRNR